MMILKIFPEDLHQFIVEHLAKRYDVEENEIYTYEEKEGETTYNISFPLVDHYMNVGDKK